MREFNLLGEYPKLDQPRLVSNKKRTIINRIIASKRDKEFFDGDRENGYGGFTYDGRWKKIVKKIFDEYKLVSNSNLLQLNSEKGFFIYDLKKEYPKAKSIGLETSNYAVKNSVEEIKNNILKVDNYTKLEFKNNSFDFVLAIGVVYALNITDLINCIKEIQRVGKGKSFINLGSYESFEEYDLFKKWSLLGSTFLKKKEWIEVLNHCGYTGDYYFTNAKTLNLKYE
tara:strand:- start:36 stop:716 length:681 start_codon:yes stop_codon:yes gene_type:complete